MNFVRRAIRAVQDFVDGQLGFCLGNDEDGPLFFCVWFNPGRSFSIGYGFDYYAPQPGDNFYERYGATGTLFVNLVWVHIALGFIQPDKPRTKR